MYTVAQPVKIKKIYHNGNHLEDKGNFCLSGSGDGTDVNISGYREYIIEQHDDERGDSVLHQCFVVGVKSDNPNNHKTMRLLPAENRWHIPFDDFVADRKNTFVVRLLKDCFTLEPLVAPKEPQSQKEGGNAAGYVGNGQFHLS